jgi:hypothetical protein
MGIQVIYLDDEDDTVSIRDRLDWVQESLVLLVLPEKGDLLTEYLDLALLRRYADSLRLEVGLVSTDHRVTSQAKALGIPVFSTVRSANKSRRGWWRGRRRRELVGHQTRLDEMDRKEVERRRKPQQTWRKWLVRYLAVILYIVTLAVLFITAVYVIPGASITLEPEVRSIEVRQQIVVDPQLESLDPSGASIPGRVLTSIQEWQAEVETTGIIEIPDSPARGSVVFVNKLEEPVTAPAGTRVRTSRSDRVVFQTMDSVDVPAEVGGTAEVEIVAVEPGLQGNVAAGLINRLDGSLATQLVVRNLEETSGGSARLESSVTDADHQRLRSQVLQQLQVRALADMEGTLSDNEFLAKDSLRLVRTIHETYSHYPGEQAQNLTLEIRAELQATAVDETLAVGRVYEELSDAVELGFELVPESLAFSSGEVLGVDGEGRVSFEMIGEGLMAARLTTEDLINAIAGQEIGVAVSYLYEHLPLRDYPSVRVWPDWFGRLPYLPVRISTQIETGW